ncbi:MAG: hypothetical protein CMK89_14155 [Pseudomonadales bacterium]|nr:hypothetical protein [Pseudomonadales bacterium]
MDVRAASSDALTLDEAVDEVAQQLHGFAPTVLVVGFSTGFSGEALATELERRFRCIIAGCTSCRGAFSISGSASAAQASLSLLAIQDPEGNYGVGQYKLNPDDVMSSARNALDMALYASGRGYESPAVIWCMLPPGEEERIIAGFQSIVGEKVPILGGSSADNDVSGQWQQISTLTADSSQIVVLVLYPSSPLSYAFSSGYQPGANKVTVTKCNGRLLEELNHVSAPLLYNQLTQNAIETRLQGGDILSASTLFPLGRLVSSSSHYEEYLLSHPHMVTPDGAITLFSEVAEGEELTIMAGSRDSLIHRAERVLGSAVELLDDNVQPAGVLMIYCAGCMLAIDDDLEDMVDGLRECYPGLPIMGLYTFGEQGCFMDGKSRHGNLMISALVFTKC